MKLTDNQKKKYLLIKAEIILEAEGLMDDKLKKKIKDKKDDLDKNK